MNFISIITLLFLAISCGDDKFKKIETLETGLRVLAIKTASPELNLGGSTTVQLLLSDLNKGRTVTGTMEGCIDPGISRGATPSCQHDANKTSTALSINTAALNGNASASFVGWSNSISVSLNGSAATYFAAKESRDQYNGVPYLLLFRLDDNGTEVLSYKRILLTSRTTLNTNPTITNLYFNGSVASGIPSTGTYLTTNASGAESYSYINQDGSTETKTEELSMAWYTNQGTFDLPKSGITTNVEYKTESNPTTLVLVAIVRDERGGVEAYLYKSP